MGRSDSPPRSASAMLSRFRASLRYRLLRVLFGCLDGMIWTLTNAGLWDRKTRGDRIWIREYHGVRYAGTAGHARQKLNIYQPRTHAKPLPIVMYIHGGGFSQCSLGTHVAPAITLARAGFLVFNVDYRLAPAEPYPAAPHDVSMAYRWIAENAQHYGGDIERLHVAGESAGGNLVSGLLIGCCYRRPEAWMQRVWSTGIVPASVHMLCGYHQVSDPERYAYLREHGLMAKGALWVMHMFASNYLGERYPEASEDALLADPARFFERGIRPDRALPRLAVSVGTHDVIHGESVRLCRALDALGAQTRWLEYGGEPHGFQLMLLRPAARRFWAATLEWMTEDGKEHATGPLPGTAADTPAASVLTS